MPRPILKPTEEQRKRVKSFVAVGVPHAEIARLIGVRSPKTLRKHFRTELDRALVEANASVAGALYNKAMDGDVGAMKFWLANRAAWHSRPASEPSSVQPPAFVVRLPTGGSQS